MFELTSAMLEPLSNGVVANVGTVAPFGLLIFGAIAGLGLIPRLLGKFI